MRWKKLVPWVVLGLLACDGKGRDRAQAERADSAVRGGPPVAPALTGTVAGGGDFSLEELRGSPVVLVFYRGAYCGLCLRRLQALEEHKDAYDELDAKIVAATPDSPETAERTADELDLDFPIVSVTREVAERWGVWPAGENVPRPATFVLDQHGRIRFRHIGQTAADRVSDIELLGRIRALRSETRQVVTR